MYVMYIDNFILLLFLSVSLFSFNSQAYVVQLFFFTLIGKQYKTWAM